MDADMLPALWDAAPAPPAHGICGVIISGIAIWHEYGAPHALGGAAWR